MQRLLIFSATGLSLVGLLTMSVGVAQTGRPTLRAAVTTAQPTGAPLNGTVASQAAYGERAGEGRVATSTPAETAQESGSAEDFGRPNPGRPAFQDTEFTGEGVPPQDTDEPTQNEESGEPDGGDGEADAITVADGFFFDNYTSGSGFGVYGGEAVTSGQERQLELPSAALVFQGLGFQTGPGPQDPAAQPQD